MRKKIFLLLLVIAVTGVTLWGLLHLAAAKRDHLRESTRTVSNPTKGLDAAAWYLAMEKVKADRGGEGSGALKIPPELQHYSDRHWFLATQVAEISGHNVRTCQDYVDLASMIYRGELVPLPAVTDTYVLFGVGAKADDGVFTRYEDDHRIELYDQAQLSEVYRRLDEKRSALQSEIASLNVQAGKLSKRDRTKQSDLQKQIISRQQELEAADKDKSLLDQFYAQPESRQKIVSDYESLKRLANSFNGRSFNLDNPSDRQAMKVNMLSSLRPEALNILERVAAAYHSEFDRPLPVSSLVRPEQYQHTLRRVNRNAVLIETPPHSTGLAFDIDYRYMSAAEQNFLMAELARLKNEGRIEVIRERNANYHVFVFVDGTRPSDELITASLDKATVPVEEANHTADKPAKVKSEPKRERKAKSKTRKRRR